MRPPLAACARFVCARHVAVLTPNGATLAGIETGRMRVPSSLPERLLVAMELPIAEVLQGVVLFRGHVRSPRVLLRGELEEVGRGPCGSRRMGPKPALGVFTA